MTIGAAYAYSDLAEIKWGDLKSFFKECKKDNLSDTKIIDLANLENLPPHGVYIFFDEKMDVIYVGKCSSQPFIGRIPPHFDTRANSYFNNVLRNMVKKNEITMEEAHEKLSNYKFTLICCDPQKTPINGVERILIHRLYPPLNLRKANKTYDDNMTLDELAEKYRKPNL